MALVAFNLYAVVMAVMQAVHPDQNIHDEVSDYYIAEEMVTIFNKMNLILEEEDWTPFVTCNRAEFCCLILELAGKIELKKFKKHKRGDKKPSPPKNKYKGKPHVSTARLLS